LLFVVFMAVSLLFGVAATVSKQTFSTDVFFQYDVNVSGSATVTNDLRVVGNTTFIGNVLRGASPTNMMVMVADSSLIPAAVGSTAVPYSLVCTNDYGYICVTQNWAGTGTNWLRFGLSAW
jgi:hypothetical protein